MELDKDVVRRVLAMHYRPGSQDRGPSWLTLLGHAKNSLWSVDLFRTESILLKTHWVLVVMDVYTRRIIGFGVQAAGVDGPALCWMFNQAISGKGLPGRLSFDHDPLFEFQRWQANLRILQIESVHSVRYAPVSHPFIERPDRNLTPRVFGPDVLLEQGGFGTEAGKLQRQRNRASLRA
jgi:putative transposase